jgi:CRISPR-associated protein Cas1
MAWRGLHLTQPSRLSLADDQIVVGQDDGEVRLALEDVAWVVIDSPRTSLTAALMSACMVHGIAVIFTDATHTPSGVALPFHRHHRQAEVAARQTAATAPLKKRLWQALVRAKIDNQASALDAVGAGGGRTLREMAKRVGSGDPGNVEAQAARYYWGQLWKDFRRQDDGDRRNKLLNYGYSVVRSGIARALVGSGLVPAFGLKHASVSNAFNLADDVVEPFRPFIDVLAWRTVDGGAPSRDDLSVADRRVMAGCLLGEVRLGDETVTLLTASERTADSLVRAIEAATPAVLILPTLIMPTPPP